MSSQLYLSRFHEKSVSKELHKLKGGTLWDKCMGHIEVSHNASFQFLSEDISFLPVALTALPNVT